MLRILKSCKLTSRQKNLHLTPESENLASTYPMIQSDPSLVGVTWELLNSLRFEFPANLDVCLEIALPIKNLTIFLLGLYIFNNWTVH